MSLQLTQVLFCCGSHIIFRGDEHTVHIKKQYTVFIRSCCSVILDWSVEQEAEILSKLVVVLLYFTPSGKEAHSPETIAGV